MEQNDWVDKVIRLMRPLVTFALVGMMVTIILHGTMWCGDFRFVTLGTSLSTVVVGFWFGKREGEKTVEMMNKLLEKMDKGSFSKGD